MIMEMVGSRLLSPSLGSSIIIWTGLIGIILAFLALGARYGGVVSDRHASKAGLAKILNWTSLGLFFIVLIHPIITQWLMSVQISLYLGTIIATVLFFAWPSFTFGMITPYTIKLAIINEEQTGTIVGRISAWSTAGSILGTFAGGFFLISWLGCREILLLSTVILGIISLLLFHPKHYLSFLRLFFILGCLGYTCYLFYHRNQRLIESQYQTIIIEDQMTDEGIFRRLQTEPNRTQSCMLVDAPEVLAARYTNFYAIAPCLYPEGKTVLMLGGGAYSIPMWITNFYPEMQIDVVELDPAITQVARDFFSLKSLPAIHIFHDDARHFLNLNQKQYDFLFLDVFNSSGAVPFHLVTEEAIIAMRRSLTSKGIFMANLVASQTGPRKRVFFGLYHALKKHFATVLVFAVQDPQKPEREQNLMILAMPQTISPMQRALTQIEDIETFASHTLSDFFSQEVHPLVPDSFPIPTDDFAPIERYTYF